MPCFSPLVGYRSRQVGPTGRRSITFNPSEAFSGIPLKVPCGQCVGCRLERSRQWALRCVHEAQLYDENCFITLTYANEHLPDDYSVDVREFQLFMKRLRKYAGKRIRFFHCGEYGEENRRPHYHALIFGYDFHDKVLHQVVRDVRYYTSETLQRLWPFGFCIIGDLTFESAAYCARYIMKKVTGEPAEAHYTIAHPLTGEIVRQRPEYITMSRRPGIAAEWFEKFKSDVYPDDFVVHRGVKMAPPKFFDKKLSEEELEAVKRKRKHRAHRYLKDNTKDRLRVREAVTAERVSRLRRSLKED